MSDIETGVALPTRWGQNAAGARTGATKKLAALRDAPVGSSVLFAGPLTKLEKLSLGRHANYYLGTGNLATRSVDGGYRIWKIAEREAASEDLRIDLEMSLEALAFEKETNTL